eukprot:SAG31_NODE_26927_length_434_cov_0.674627_1_plen_51_part_00
MRVDIHLDEGGWDSLLARTSACADCENYLDFRPECYSPKMKLNPLVCPLS